MAAGVRVDDAKGEALALVKRIVRCCQGPRVARRRFSTQHPAHGLGAVLVRAGELVATIGKVFWPPMRSVAKGNLGGFAAKANGSNEVLVVVSGIAVICAVVRTSAPVISHGTNGAIVGVTGDDDDVGQTERDAEAVATPQAMDAGQDIPSGQRSGRSGDTLQLEQQLGTEKTFGETGGRQSKLVGGLGTRVRLAASPVVRLRRCFWSVIFEVDGGAGGWLSRGVIGIASGGKQRGPLERGEKGGGEDGGQVHEEQTGGGVCGVCGGATRAAGDCK